MAVRIVIEKNIPFISGLLDRVADVRYLAADEINAVKMRDADALITRTRARCDAALLDGSCCRFIATATIGTDHIDLDYCKHHGITVANAPGCNAPAVAQYVFASIAALKKEVEGLTIGIVGVGHVGRIVERWARQLGMNVLLCDPPRAEEEGHERFVSLDVIASRSDIVTFHTPLTRNGKYPTFHLCGEEFLGALERNPVIVNCARGEVVDTQELIDAMDDGRVSEAVIDCWEGEPHVSPDLLERALIATPHIAGYSREGKIRATSMALMALCRHFDLPEINVTERVPDGATGKVTLEAIKASYDPVEDTRNLKKYPESFEALRNNYRYRNEVK